MSEDTTRSGRGAVESVEETAEETSAAPVGQSPSPPAAGERPEAEPGVEPARPSKPPRQNAKNTRAQNAGAQTREDRLAGALRANLRRRKAAPKGDTTARGPSLLDED